MNNLIIILTVIDVMISLLLIAVILVQQSKDGGFGGAAFGGAGEAVFGGQAGDHLSKFTVILATLFFIVTLSLAIVTGRRTGGDISVVEGDAAVTEMSAESKKTPLKTTTPNDVIEEIAGDKAKSINTTKSEKIAIPLPVSKDSKPLTKPEDNSK